MIAVDFMVFRFYFNLLTAGFARSGAGVKRLNWAIKYIFTPVNFGVAMIAAIINYILLASSPIPRRLARPIIDAIGSTGAQDACSRVKANTRTMLPR